jgi:deoxyribonuclease-4
MSPPAEKRRHQEGERILLGAHFSIAGGLHKALLTAQEYGCTALQIFTKNASTWKERRLSTREIEQFQATRRQSGVRSICAHAAYLINLASPDRRKYEKSIMALEQELLRSSHLGILHVIMHPGAHMGMGEEKGCRRIAEGINTVFDHVLETTCGVLLETTAGQGSNLGYTFEHLAGIADRVDAKDRIGFCFDTCHVFAAGYDLRTKMAYGQTMKAFDTTLGLERLHVIHLNDSKKGLGSRTDRHAHIGEGDMGIDTFRFVMNDPRLKAIPKILETPKETGPVDYDRLNLARLRNLVQQGGHVKKKAQGF